MTGDGRGYFMTFEGGEGSGKSVQAQRLAERLKDRGLSVTLTREPGGTPAAETIRSLLVTGDKERWTAKTEALLYAAARADHLDRLIRPRLAAGDFVICDRFADSTRAYQGMARGAPLDFIDALTTLVVGSDWPDLTVILDVDVETGLTRARKRGGSETRYEAFDRSFHEALRRAYRVIAEKNPDRCIVVDSTGMPDDVAAVVWSLVAARCGL